MGRGGGDGEGWPEREGYSGISPDIFTHSWTSMDFQGYPRIRYSGISMAILKYPWIAMELYG